MIGSNLLNQALRLVGKQTVLQYKFVDRTTNSIGIQVPRYETPINIVGSLQPVPASMYEKLGLDFDKKYYTFYTSADVATTTRDIAGDYIIIENIQYQAESNLPGNIVDGWSEVTVVLIGEYDPSKIVTV